MKQQKINHLEKVSKIAAVNLAETEKAMSRTQNLSRDVSALDQKQIKTEDDLNSLLADIDNIDINNIDLDALRETNLITSADKNPLEKKVQYEPLAFMQETTNFDDLFGNSDNLAKKMNLSLDNPYLSGLSEREINQLSTVLAEKYEASQLDKYDYAFSGLAGIIGGLVDAFFVGSITDGNNVKTKSEQGIISKNADKVCDKIITKYASFESKKDMQSVKQSIKWLEDNHHVSYDASNNGRIANDSIQGMNMSNHHLLSIAHDPGPLGLFFGIIDQLDGKSSFFDGGKITRVITTSKEQDTVTEAIGSQKIIEAVKNWFGHVMSDVGGASGSVGRGAGLPAPFYSLTQELKFGHVNVKGKDKDFAGVAEWIYKQGLDLRAVTAQAVPVIVMETLIRLYWVYKRHFYYGHGWKESTPVGNKPDLQKLLLVGAATFEFTDVSDAMIRNGPDVTALLRINFVNVVDLGFHSFIVLRNSVVKRKKLLDEDKDIQLEWERISETI